MRIWIPSFILFLTSTFQTINSLTTSTSQPDQPQINESIAQKFRWGTYRPDLLYEYSTHDAYGLAFGIMFHSNQNLDSSRIERCPKFTPESPTTKQPTPPCKSLPVDYESEIRYEINENNSATSNLSANYRIHDGQTYHQQVIEDNAEILINIKTLKLQNDSWSSFINAQRSQKKKHSSTNSSPTTTTQLNHNIYFYFACHTPNQQDFKSCFTIQKNHEQNTTDNKSTTSFKIFESSSNNNEHPNNGYFTIESLKNQVNFELEVKVLQEPELNFRSADSSGNMRRFLQQDILGFISPQSLINDQPLTGNIVIVRAKLLNIDRSILRVNYSSSQEQPPLTNEDIIRQMKSAESSFLKSLHARIILPAISNPPSQIMEIASVALSQILGNIFHVSSIRSGNPFTHQKSIFGIASSREYHRIEPSLYNDGYTLQILSAWDFQLAQLIISSSINHRNIDGNSYINRKNVLSIISSDYNTINLKKPIQFLPSIYLSIPRIMQNTNQTPEFTKQFTEYIEDTLFNVLAQRRTNDIQPQIDGTLFHNEPVQLIQLELLSYGIQLAQSLSNIINNQIDSQEYADIARSLFEEIKRTFEEEIEEKHEFKLLLLLKQVIPLILQSVEFNENDVLKIIREFYEEQGIHIQNSIISSNENTNVGEESMLVNYHVFKTISAFSTTNDEINTIYRDVYNSLLENIMKNYNEQQQIFLQKNDHSSISPNYHCRFIPALATLLLILDENYS